ncbi:MAG: hypothetical protein ACLQDA_15990 [Terracidiphilus sp.]
MLTIDFRDLYTMNGSRKGALLMLSVVVFWAAMPASACLLGIGHTGLPDCCRAVAQSCDSAAMTADCSCCQVHGNNPAVTPVTPFSLRQPQKLAVAAHQASMKLPAAPGGSYRNDLETPPPQFPPGGSFALRI